MVSTYQSLLFVIGGFIFHKDHLSLALLRHYPSKSKADTSRQGIHFDILILPSVKEPLSGPSGLHSSSVVSFRTSVNRLSAGALHDS
jgi:hypothetical protein